MGISQHRGYGTLYIPQNTTILLSRNPQKGTPMFAKPHTSSESWPGPLPSSCFQQVRCSFLREANKYEHRSSSELSDTLAIQFGVGPRFLRRTLGFLLGNASQKHAEERRSFLYREFLRRGCGPELIPECRPDGVGLGK